MHKPSKQTKPLLHLTEAHLSIGGSTGIHLLFLQMKPDEHFIKMHWSTTGGSTGTHSPFTHLYPWMQSLVHTFTGGSTGVELDSQTPSATPRYYVLGYLLVQAWQSKVKFLQVPSLLSAQYLGFHKVINMSPQFLKSGWEHALTQPLYFVNI